MTTLRRSFEPRPATSLNDGSSFSFHESRDSAGTVSVDGPIAFACDSETPVADVSDDPLMPAEATGAAVTSTRRPPRTIAPTINKLSALRAMLFDIRLPLPQHEKRAGIRSSL